MAYSAEYAEGFEINDWAVIATSGWTTVFLSASPTIVADPAITDGGARSLQIGGGAVGNQGRGVQKSTLAVGGGDQRYFGFHAKIAGSASTSHGLGVVFLRSGNSQFELRLRTDGFGDLYRGGSLVATSGAALATGTWHWFTVDLDAQNSGSCTVLANGAAFVSFSGDCQNNASPGWNGVQFVCQGNATIVGTYNIDNVVSAPVGAAAVPPQIGINMRVANADGSVIQFTPVGNPDNFDNIDENPPNTADYNESSTPGDRDLFTVASLPVTPTSIPFVMVQVYAAISGGATGVSGVVESNGSDDVGAAQVPGASGVYGLCNFIFPQNPDGVVDWDLTSANALEFGYEGA